MQETRALAKYIVESAFEDIPTDVCHEARRALLNYLGCALGGSRETAVDLAIQALSPFSGPPNAAILGRVERMDPLHAALMNGISSHVHDYDDTLPKNYIHPSSPLASALFAFASANHVRGQDFVHAFVLGFEAESRVGNAVFPAHYEAGWHITGTAGVFGAAAGVGKLLGLSVQQMVWALGLAATQAAGLREMFGSMGKSFHPGRSAQNGYTAALLARGGFTAGESAIEGPRGFAAVQSPRFDLGRITEGLGVDFDLRVNAYKPFPCGIVNHPTIDGAIQLHNAHGLTANAIRAIRLRVAPLVIDLCGKQFITTGLEGKFSVYHGAAAGLVRGRAGIAEYTDEAVNDPDIRRLRENASAVPDPKVTEDQAQIDVELVDGTVLTTFVEQSLGNLKRPMSDSDLEAKFIDQSVVALTKARVDNLVELIWKIDTLDDIRRIVETAIPG